jgi:hypothetical protein
VAYPIQLEYYNGQCCGATIQLFWESPSQTRQIVPQSQLFPPCSFPPQLAIRQLNGSQTVLEWATNSCGFRLMSTESLSSSDWTTNLSAVASVVTNGLNTVIVNVTNAQRFFRLAD